MGILDTFIPFLGILAMVTLVFTKNDVKNEEIDQEVE